MKLRHISGKIVDVKKDIGEKMMANNPGKYEEIKSEKPKKKNEDKNA